VTFISSKAVRTYRDGEKLVSAVHASGDHIICGPEAHSYLVAGTVGDDFVIWDPDDTQVSVEQNLAGGLTLRDLFRQFTGEPIEFWRYRCEFS
jgi:hypothetical protein